MINIYTSYYANYKNIDPAFLCVSISNTKPSCLFMIRLKQLAPPWYIVNSYRNKEISKEFFGQMYIQHLQNNVGFTEIEKTLLNLNSSDIVLMCYEKDSSLCHRSILSNWLKVFLSKDFSIRGELSFK